MLQAQDIDLNQFTDRVVQSYLQQEAPAQSSSLEKNEKSYGAAIVLGLSPIPGDGLYYTRHPVQGTLALVYGGVGLALIAQGMSCTGEDCGVVAIPVGLTIYGACYLWDAIGSIVEGRKYKKPPVQELKPAPSDSNRTEKINQIDLLKDPDLE